MCAARVHEYGGGEFGFVGDAIVYVAGRGEGIVSIDRGPVRGCVPKARYADFAGSPDGRFLLAVEEDASAGDEPANRLVAFDREKGAAACPPG